MAEPFDAMITGRDEACDHVLKANSLRVVLKRVITMVKSEIQTNLNASKSNNVPIREAFSPSIILMRSFHGNVVCSIM